MRVESSDEDAGEDLLDLHTPKEGRDDVMRAARCVEEIRCFVEE